MTQKKANKKQRRSKKSSTTRVNRNRKKYTEGTTSSHHYSVILIIISLLANIFLVFNYITHNKVKEIPKIVEKETMPENIVFLGDSITDYYDLEKYYPDHFVVNSGISGNTTDDILSDMEKRVYQYNPSKVFLLIGTNDLNKGKTAEEILNNIKKIVQGIEEYRKSTHLYIESVYPVNYDVNSTMVENRKNEDIKIINQELKEYCQQNKITYINTYEKLVDNQENLKEEYTDDGLHLNENGYKVITEILKKYLNEN